MAVKIPVAGQTYTFGVSVVSQADTDIFKSAPTIAAGDFQRSINGAAFGNLDNLPTVTPAGGKRIEIVLSAAETTAAGAGGHITVVWSDAAGDEWQDGSAEVTVSDADISVTTTPMLLSAGTGTGQLDFTSGVVKANLAQILGTALTETAGQIAAAFKKFFNVATPVATVETVNQTGDAYAVVTNVTHGNSALASAVGAIPTTAAAAILATPDNKLATDASGRVTPDTVTAAGPDEDTIATAVDDALTLAHGAGAWGAEMGAFSKVYTVTVGGVVKAGAYCRLCTDLAGTNSVSAGTTNSLGQVTFKHNLPAGTDVWVHVSLDGYEPLVDAETI